MHKKEPNNSPVFLPYFRHNRLFTVVFLVYQYTISTPSEVLSIFTDHFVFRHFPLFFRDSPSWPLQDSPKMTFGDHVYQ